MSRLRLRSRWITRLALAATSATLGLVATGAVLSPASADSPVKVGWWNFASGGGQAAPAPDTSAGGLRVGVSSSQMLAFGAVEYSLPRDGSATLELPITAITSNSNAPVVNQVYACPTKDDSWKAGDDQDASTAPAYNCDATHFVGRLSSNQATMTFQVDGSADVSDGVLSLAIVPAHSTAVPYVGTDPGTGTDLTPPFVIDFDKPGTNSFVSEDSSSSSSSSGDSSSPPPPPTSSGSTGSTTPPVAAPPATSDVSVPPATSDVGAGQTPVVAGQQPTGTGAGSGLTPAAAVTPAKTDNHHDLLMVLLILILFGILYTQQAGAGRAPRAIGPRAPGDGGADAAAAVPAAYPVGVYGPPRGLGRFNKQRAGAARPLI